MAFAAFLPLAISAASALINSSNSGRENLEKVPTKSPQQEKFAAGLLQQANQMKNGGGYSGANNYYNQFLGPNREEAYNQFADPYLQQFNEQVIPNIAERFGARGALSSSGFAQALGGAGAGLQSQLAQLFSQLQSQAAGAQYNQFNQLSNQGLSFDPFAYHQQPGGGNQGTGFAQGFNPSSLMALLQMGGG